MDKIRLELEQTEGTFIMEMPNPGIDKAKEFIGRSMYLALQESGIADKPASDGEIRDAMMTISQLLSSRYIPGKRIRDNSDNTIYAKVVYGAGSNFICFAV